MPRPERGQGPAPRRGRASASAPGSRRRPRSLHAFRLARDCTGFPRCSICSRRCASRAGPAFRSGSGSPLSTVAGFLLLRNERLAFRGEHARPRCTASNRCCAASSTADARCSRASCSLLPGVVSDVMALVLLALPLNVGRESRAAGGASGPPHRADASTANTGASTRRRAGLEPGPSTSARRSDHLHLSRSVGSALPARRYAQIIMTRRRRSSAATATGPS